MSSPFPSIDIYSNQRTYTVNELEQLLLADSDDDESQTVKRVRTNSMTTFELPHVNCEDELQRVMKKLELKEAQLEDKIGNDRKSLYELKLKEAMVDAKLANYERCKKYKATAITMQHMLRDQFNWIKLATRVNAALQRLVSPDVLQSSNINSLLVEYEEQTKALFLAVDEHHKRVDLLNSKSTTAVEYDRLISQLNSTSSESSSSHLEAREVPFKGKSRLAAHANALSEARMTELKKRSANRLLSSHNV
jgi:hypothetical protein